MIDLYSKWGNYIPTDLRKQFEAEWLEVEKIIVKNNVAFGDVSNRRELLNSFLDWQDQDSGMDNDKEWNKRYLDRYLKTI